MIISKIDFNGYLNNMLGFTIKAGAGSHFLTKRLKIVEAAYIHNIHAYTPKRIIVTCGIVDETVFCGECIKLLR